MRPNRHAIPLATAALLLSATARGSVTSALINKALDQQQPLTLNATLPEAIRQIGAQTGVPIEVDPAVWDLLPWGEQTNVTARVQNCTLRQGLSAITRKLGLEFTLTDEAIELRPVPALRRLGRRATVAELETLDLLASTPLNPAAQRMSVHDLLAAIDQRLASVKASVAVENGAPSATQAAVVAVAGNASLAETLEDLAQQTNATWYPWGKTLLVLSKEEQVRQQLARPVTTRYAGVDVAQVVLELSQRAGVPFTIEPGAYQRIPPADRSIRLLLDNAAIGQTLESIGGTTGLAFDVTDTGVHVGYAGDAPVTRPVQP